MRSIFFLSLLVSTAFAALPPAAADLKAKRDAKVAEIDRVYAAELDKLQRRLMADGNLQAANEVQKEIEKVTVNPFEDEKPKLEGKWSVEFVGNKTVKRSFSKTHLVDELGGKHPFTISGDTISVDWGNGLWERVKIESADEMTGTNNSGSKIVYRRLR